MEWCTYSYNNQYNELNNRRFTTRSYNINNGTVKIGKPIIQFTVDGDYIQEWTNAEMIMRTLGYDASQIHAVCKHKRKTAKGYKWIYKDEYERNLKNEKSKQII